MSSLPAKRNLKWLMTSGRPEPTAAPRTLPPKPALAANLARAAGRLVAGVAQGQAVRVSPADQARRKRICEACTGPTGWYLPGMDRCAHPRCGCYLRFKTWLVSERCPEGKW